jgi:hypothetical protein
MLRPDYQYTPKVVTAMASMIASEQFDVVLGSRILGGGALMAGCLCINHLIDLAVEDKRVAAFRVDPRLRPALEVDDRQPRMAEGDPFVDKDAVTIGQVRCSSGRAPPRRRARAG